MDKDINTSSMLRVGTILRGIYRIDGYLASGGFGNTYVATNIEFDERCAIKEFFMRGVSKRDDNSTTVSVSTTDNVATFDAQREKFKKEARRLRKLHSQYIVRVHDLFEENGTAYYVMDYIDGESLSARLKRTHKPLTEDEVSRMLPQLLEALEAAHNEGILHLDLKPANIMQERDGSIKLIDFGASKQQSARGGATTSTAVSYTNGYAPREQMEQNLDKFGPWTDFYALGATLYTLLTGHKPSLPSDIDEDHTPDKHAALPLPATVSRAMKRLVLWLMNTSRSARPQSVADIRQYLQTGDIQPDPIAVHPTEKPAPADDDETHTIRRPAGPPQPEPEVNAKPKPEPEPKPAGNVITPSVTPLHPEQPSSHKGLKIAACVAGLILIVVILLAVAGGNSSKPVATDADTAYTAEEVDTVATVEKQSIAIPFGRCTYTGQVDAAGVPDGEGEAWFEDGSYYKGHFDHGVMNDSQCYFQMENGDRYEGSMRSDAFATGTYTQKTDGSYFSGDFKGGSPYRGAWHDKYGNLLQRVAP